MELPRFGWKSTSCLVVLSCATAWVIYKARKVEGSKKSKSRNMAEAAILLSAIQKLDNYREDETEEEMERVIKEMRGILDIVRDKKSGEGRRLNFLICDLVRMADDALNVYQHCQTKYLASEMEPIHSWIGEIKLRMLKLGVDEAETTELSSTKRSENDGEGLDQYVLGLEEDVEMLLHTWIVPGMPTLARQFYNHAKVVDQFKRRAWLCVSNNLTLKELLIKLIQQVAVVDGESLHTSSLLEEMDNQSLLGMLRQHLQGMRFLIVLNDVPKQMHLHSFLDSLPDGNGSILLLTSHVKHNIIDSMDNVHMIKTLHSNKSWQFYRKLKAGRNMAEEVLLSVIQKLDKYRERYYGFTEYVVDETNEVMEMVIKEMREILDIVRDKKLGEGRRLNFLVSDLVNMADNALNIYKEYRTDEILFYMIASVQNWIIEIKMRMLKFGDDGAETTELSNMRSSENDENVVGLEEDVEMLLRTRIIRGKRRLAPFLIKGMSGSGKTTLARQLYNHAKVVDHFKCRAWVCVSNKLTLKEVLIRLIQQLAVVVDGENLHTSSLLEETNNQSLLDMLRQHLRGTQCLLVLDDLPKQMHLLSFLDTLQNQDNGSTLLLTSHMTPIDIPLDIEDIHVMEPLDSNKSWQLFLKTLNSGNKLTIEHTFPKYLEHKGKQMLKKCGGLPLAIKEVGNQLAEKKVSEGSTWEQLLESVDFGSTLKLLELFYQKLDPKLEPCFLYMAFYKENTTLRKEKLTQIWVAGEVVSTDTCELYLHDLINESVIEVKNKSTEYRMNPLLHMLSIQKAEEKLGFEILSRSNGPSQPDPRHRVIKCSREKFNYSTNQDKHLVSLFFQGGGYFEDSLSYWKRFELLKILDLEDFGLKSLPKTVGTLLELRYLGLRDNHIQELPGSLGCLVNLEVLDIAQNFMVVMPDMIWEMGSLLHLYMSDIICPKPLKIDALQKLETLTYISVDNWRYELSDLKMLTSLRKLGIEELDGNADVSKLFASLAELENLSHLILRGYCFRVMPCLDELGILNFLDTFKLDGRLGRLPNSFPSYMSSLTLVNSCLDKDPMPLLEKLPRLTNLKLRNAYTGQQMVIMKRGFRNLEVLCIEELRHLRNVQTGKGAMWHLKKLEMKNCPYLDTLPEEIGSMIYLKELKMVTTKNIAKKIRNSDLISKIPMVSISA